MRRRHSERQTARQAENAALCGLPLTEYLALPRRERKRRVRAARAASACPPCARCALPATTAVGNDLDDSPQGRLLREICGPGRGRVLMCDEHADVEIELRLREDGGVTSQRLDWRPADG